MKIVNSDNFEMLLTKSQQLSDQTLYFQVYKAIITNRKEKKKEEIRNT